MLTGTKENQAESKAAFWQNHIENCNRSSLTQAQYCRDHSLALATFCYWKKKLKMSGYQQARFYPLTVQSAQPSKKGPSPAGLVIHLGKDELRVEIAEDFSALALKKLIATLKQL